MTAEGTKVCPAPACSSAGAAQPLENYWRNKRNKDGLQSWCKTCLRAEHQRQRETIRSQMAASLLVTP